jgi:lipopolysaccharide/colanic/teichoic acid biosynthesis glycosyltransferase
MPNEADRRQGGVGAAKTAAAGLRRRTPERERDVNRRKATIWGVGQTRPIREQVMGFIESRSTTTASTAYQRNTQGIAAAEAAEPLNWDHSTMYLSAPAIAERLGGKPDVPANAPFIGADPRRVAGYPAAIVETATTLPLAHRINHAAYLANKRALDVLAALLFLVLFAPVLLLIAFLIYLEEGGPVLYSHDRVGQNGRLFRFYKFRSMVINADALKAELTHQNEADGPIFKIKDDPRITRVGRVLRKYSLDELPQFVNVLRGDMSLVGPRPHLPREIEECERKESFPGGYPWARLSVPPGLICLREVTGRSNLSFTRWLELDLLYVQRRSLLLDTAILLRAIPAILRGDGAC